VQVDVTTQTKRRPGGHQLPLAAMVVAGGLMLSGCVTVHGEDALLPAIGGRPEAAKVLADYTAKSNQANRKLDTKLNARVETGVLGALDHATLTVEHAAKPKGNPGYDALALSDATYLIPRQRGWPRWFVANTANNRDHNRWLLAFTRGGPDEQWKASYLAVLEPGQVPKFAIDKDGHAEAVAPDASGLAVAPGKLSARYTDYLGDGKPSDFADGQYTSQLRAARPGTSTAKYVAQYADEAAPAQTYPPLALRTADGGALVLFTSKHSWKITGPKGSPPPASDSYTKTLITGDVQTAVTRQALAEQVALVPTGSGKVEIADRISGITAARGQ
jgi:hypothetical protein